MGKAAGIWKKFKQVAKTVGHNVSKAFSWLNENLIRKNKPFIDPLIKQLPGGETISKVVDKASDFIHERDERKGRKVNTKAGDLINEGIKTAIKTKNQINEAPDMKSKFKIVKDNTLDYANRNKQDFHALLGDSQVSDGSHY